MMVAWTTQAVAKQNTQFRVYLHIWKHRTQESDIRVSKSESVIVVREENTRANINQLKATGAWPSLGPAHCICTTPSWGDILMYEEQQFSRWIHAFVLSIFFVSISISTPTARLKMKKWRCMHPCRDCTNMNIVSDCFALHWELKVRNIKKIHIPRIDDAVFTNPLCFCRQISKTWNVRERL